jgi:hypothetical protein
MTSREHPDMVRDVPACRRWLTAKTRPLRPPAAGPAPDTATRPGPTAAVVVAGLVGGGTQTSTPRAEDAVSVPVAVHSAAESNDHA